jgi:C1A family cysteine protease
MLRKYGWRPDVPDYRDRYKVSPPPSVELPPKVDLRDICPPVFDQLSLGSCTANAILAAYACISKKHNQPTEALSRLFLYYNERVIEDTVAYDSGAQIRTGIKCLSKHGCCHEEAWPYDINRFIESPPDSCYKQGSDHQVLEYSRLQRSALSLKHNLSQGYPFVFGFMVYDSIEKPEVAKTGIIQMPRNTEQPMGGHAVMCAGYDDASGHYLILNSWGPGWGDKGYCYLPYEYMHNPDLSDDFWSIRKVE